MKTDMNLMHEKGVGSDARHRLLASIVFFGSKQELDFFIKTLELVCSQDGKWRWVIE